ncbi:MAG: pyruvate kinase, partial [Ruminococcaceae bacterium]|nr:pyruvate kinase [Oscillospiraceae bacterium]
MRKTKIVCTMGPSVDQDDIMRQLILQGMNVARFNFSHGGHEEHRLRIDRLKRLREELDLPIAALLDTKGPEIRTGVFEHGSITLNENDTVIVQAGDMPGTEKLIPVSYATIADDVSEGSSILIDDGLVELEVLRVENGQVICRVRNSGTISNHKGINLPGTSINLPALAERDKEDIIFGIENGFDFVAASFVRKPEDVMEIRRFLDKHGGEALNIIAKIESREGIENFDRILKVADGIMVARGDLGVEIPMQEVPIVQKNLIEKCYKIGKPCITATQMLDSMIRNPRPTRAEVSDVANAIYDGTSAIMLSGETAMGRYP